MTGRIVLAYSGGIRSSAAIGWLRERYQADVITLTVDVGQERDLEEIRERALALGAVRAHVLDRRDACAATAIAALGAAAGAPLDGAIIAALPATIVAPALAEVAGIEHATRVAHVAHAAPAAAVARPLPDAIARACPLPIVDVAGEWAVAATDGVQQARARGVPLPAPAPRWSASRHLLCRPVADTAADALPPAAGTSADVTFVDGLPVAVADVAFPATELLECLSLLGSRHGVGRLVGGPGGSDAPAAVMLHAAYGVLPQPNGVVRLTLRHGSCTAAALDRAVVTG